MTRKGIDVKLNVKPGYLHLIHRSAYEGPCRSGSGHQLTPEFDREIGEEKFAAFKETLEREYSDEVNMMDPVYLTWTDQYIFTEEQMKKLTEDMTDVDLFLFDGVFHQFPASEISTRFKKPVGIIGCCASTDGVAAIRAKGLPAHGYIDHQDAASQMQYLRVKKAMRRTNVLVVLKNDIVSKGVLSTITNLQQFTMDQGVRFTFINAEDMLQEVRRTSEEREAEARDIADDLIANADECYMEKDALVKSVRFYLAVKSLLDQYECNAFTLPCFEICATKQLDKEQYTFCLAHALLKEEGIPSACEADINVLMAMNVMINLTRKAPHMGNTHPLAQEEKTDQSIPSGLRLIPELEGRENVVSTWHAVPTRKMKGIDGEMLPYTIQPFTHGGWGATLRYDYNRDKGETITLLRFHPNGRKMFAVRGTIIGGAGFDEIGCQTGVYWEVEDVRDFFKKELEFGHHYAWVYGDYIEDLHELGDVLNVEVVTA